MAVTETTTVSWGSRLGSSLKGVLVGGLVFLLMKKRAATKAAAPADAAPAAQNA